MQIAYFIYNNVLNAKVSAVAYTVLLTEFLNHTTLVQCSDSSE
jgi:hypothetical protein